MSNAIKQAAKAALLALVAGAVALGLAGPAGASAGAIVYGDPAAAAKWWRLQSYDDCAIMASADVVGQITGKEPAEPDIIAMAQSTPSTVHPGSIYIKPVDTANPNSGNGTNRQDLPALLARYGVTVLWTDADKAERTGVATGIDALKRYLGRGRAVIVSLNAEMIWGLPPESPESNHSVVVTGIDTTRGVVHLNDSGTKKGRDEQIPLEVFTRAWATSHEFMIVTTGTVK